MPNNNQICNTSYYALPCGRQLEDFIAAHWLDFLRGSALKYYWRAGKKDGESRIKDLRKCIHFCRLMCRRDGWAPRFARICVRDMATRARRWNGRS